MEEKEILNQKEILSLDTNQTESFIKNSDLCDGTMADFKK
jgi:hypothetical protein